MVLFIQDHRAALDAVIVTVGVSVVAETWATHHGHARATSAAGRLRELVGSLLIAVAPRNRGAAATADRGTKRIIVLGTLAAGVVAVEIASRSSAARWGSNDWFGVVVGISVALAGIALRAWAVASLGRYFQREVVIEQGQTIVRSGPYRWLRHPAYTGNLVALFGFGVAVGSWLGALVATAIAFAAHLPRIRIEEQVLHAAFPDSFRDYATDTDRLVPGVW